MESTVCFTVTFDRTYLEPSVITLYELWASRDSRVKEIVGIIILTDSDRADPNIHNDLHVLKQLIYVTNGSELGIKIIMVRDNLPQIRSIHFNNVVIHKLLSPTYVDTTADFQLNLDAGFLVGEKFNKLVSCFLGQLSSLSGAVLGLLGEDNLQLLPSPFREATELDFYPKGGVLLFNRASYLVRKKDVKFLEIYKNFFNNFVYPDQELLSIGLSPGEIVRLVDFDCQSVFIRNLFPDYTLRGANTRIANSEFSLYKIAGLLKPWHYFVLDPEKSTYLSRRARVEKLINLDKSESIEKSRSQIPRFDLTVLGLRHYEIELVLRHKTMSE